MTARCDCSVDVQPVVGHELVQVAGAVGDQADLEAQLAEVPERRHRIVVEAEVVRALPAALDVDRALAGARLSPMPRTIRSVKAYQISSSCSASGCLSVVSASMRAWS